MGEVCENRCTGMRRLCLRLADSDYGTSHIQTTNHPLGEALLRGRHEQYIDETM